MNKTKVRGLAATRATATAEADPLQSLDRIDRAILRQLQTDASISNVALAARVKLSAPAC